MRLQTDGFINPKHDIEYLYVFTTSSEVLFLIYDYSDSVIYKVICDKLLTIMYYNAIEVPDELKDFYNLKIFKATRPRRTDKVSSGIDDYVLSGMAKINDSWYKVSIADDVITLKEDNSNYTDRLSSNLLECLNGLCLSSFMQKGNYFYVLGLDEDDEDLTPFYGIVDIEKDRFSRFYYLTTDFGKIYPVSINVDLEDKKIYAVGAIVNDNSVSPYLEIFTPID
jgi:hypothetical protein